MVSGEWSGITESDTVWVESSGSGARFDIVGRGASGLSSRQTDLWVRGTLGLTGGGFSGGCFFQVGEPSECGEFPVFVWDLNDPASPAVVAELPTPSALVNDVKISPDGSFAVAGLDLNAPGLFLLDLSTPGAVRHVGTFEEGLVGGIHNLWIEEIDGTDYVFAADHGRDEGGLRIIDVSDLEAPRQVGFVPAGEGSGRSIHDVYVREGLAFLSHFSDGLIIMDVGNGSFGGTPDSPVEISRSLTEVGEIHNAWYWPERSLVFVGEEDGTAPELGKVWILDVSNLAGPIRIATFDLKVLPPHNFWVDEAQEILYVAWYELGVRAIDVSGTLSGELSTQDRELAAIAPLLGDGRASFWSPQLENGLIFASESQTGIWSFRLVVTTTSQGTSFR